MRKAVWCLISMLLCSGLMAADSPWKVKGIVGASYNSTSVTDNWSGSEKNSQSWGAKLDASAERDTAGTNWMNTLKEEYGRAKVAGTDEQTSADTIDFSSVYSKKMSAYVNPYVGLLVNTQNWRMADPITYTESLGNGVWIINTPAQQLKTRAGIAFKQYYDSPKDKLDAATGLLVKVSAADDPATPEIEDWKASTGGEWITNYDLVLNQDVKFASEARVFSAFKGGANLRWDNNLYVKLASIVTMQLNYLAVYNFDAAPQPVWPQDVEKRLTLTVGVSYNLF